KSTVRFETPSRFSVHPAIHRHPLPTHGPPPTTPPAPNYSLRSQLLTPLPTTHSAPKKLTMLVIASHPMSSAAPDDLTGVKDDMIAFVEGHGMRRFHGYVEFEEVQSVMWESNDNPDAWKDFVELAKAAGAPFLTMHAWVR